MSRRGLSSRGLARRRGRRAHRNPMAGSRTIEGMSTADELYLVWPYVAVLAGLENVWCDFAQHPDTADASWDLHDLVRGLGAGRLLFGSDAPYADYRLLQEQIEAARI